MKGEDGPPGPLICPRIDDHMVRSVVRQMKKKTQQRSNKEEIGPGRPSTGKDQEKDQLNEEGKKAASKLLDMAQRWRASRREGTALGRYE